MMFISDLGLVVSETTDKDMRSHGNGICSQTLTCGHTYVRDGAWFGAGQHVVCQTCTAKRREAQLEEAVAYFTGQRA